MVRLFLVGTFLLYAVNIPAFAEEDEDGPVTNVRVTRQGKINIFLEYDLAGSPTDVFSVTLTVKVKSDSAFAYTPINVIGDIGTNIRPGSNKRISWRISDEYIPALDLDDVEYSITATPPPREGSTTELFIIGGAAVVGLTLAIAILSSNKADEQQRSNVFPPPPGRP